MKTDTRSLRRAGAATLVGAVGLVGALALAWGRASPGRAFVPRPVAREWSDLAVACLATGEVRPAVSELSTADLDAIVEILARLVGAYERADFDSFLALRARDLDYAAGQQGGHLAELRFLCLDLGLDPARLPADWPGLLHAYWEGYYLKPPVARFHPEDSVVVLHDEGLGGRAIDAWERGFEELSAGQTGFRIRHRPTMPHRRSIERVAADSGNLRWLDVQLGYEPHDGGTGRLIARFVWDGSTQEWFLHRADTIHDGEHRDDRGHLVL